MKNSYFPAEGEIIDPDDLNIPKAKELVRLIRPGNLPYVSFM